MAEDLKNIIKEGWLEKESKYLKQWRSRWFVLTSNSIYSFKDQKIYKGPTEVIPLSTITTIKSTDDETSKENSFKIELSDRRFYMAAPTNLEKELWIGAVGKAMVKKTLQSKNAVPEGEDFD
ncbi:hypothetical protein PPERSA_12500 [Pseudocohnilembus persalinus]|uniref:PH domain-containing protein n=1 Tax=Pseudocohnilembus persalinus TaxID=266149 RepID=A0A0V0QPZ3_PSEPJ|nr:hypothetical protein PPERSA_12500 [Pseudocohnilembus persalinus]|eukprot:KRX04053.1 hypothetical protein PPERSA_12500 [Pseudocohnilembus persalinus]